MIEYDYYQFWQLFNFDDLFLQSLVKRDILR